MLKLFHFLSSTFHSFEVNKLQSDLKEGLEEIKENEISMGVFIAMEKLEDILDHKYSWLYFREIKKKYKNNALF